MLLNLNTTEETLKFVSFLEEAVSCVDQWTPTQINSGGCGYFAAILYDKLKSEGIDSKIMALFWAEDEVDKVEKNFFNYIKTGQNADKSAAGHICLDLFNLLYFDSTGIVNPVIYHAREHVEITRKQLEEINEKGNWSEIFDKGCIPIIKQKLDEMFDKYTNFTPGTLTIPSGRGIELSVHTVKKLKEQDPLYHIFGG